MTTIPTYSNPNDPNFNNPLNFIKQLSDNNVPNEQLDNESECCPINKNPLNFIIPLRYTTHNRLSNNKTEDCPICRRSLEDCDGYCDCPD